MTKKKEPKNLTRQQEEIELLKIKFIEYFAEVPIQKYAAASIGRSEETIIEWKKADPNFSNQLESTKADYLKRQLGKVRSKEWIIERLFKDHFSARKELTGADGEKLEAQPILVKFIGETDENNRDSS
jgi:hypothetical protein